MELSRAALAVAIVAGFAGVLLFTPYEAYLEGVIAFAIIIAAVVGFLMHPRREVLYVRTSVRLIDPDRRQALEHDLLAVKVELVRLWVLFVLRFCPWPFSYFWRRAAPQSSVI